jgi:hypothetical protein
MHSAFEEHDVVSRAIKLHFTGLFSRSKGLFTAWNFDAPTLHLKSRAAATFSLNFVAEDLIVL